MRTKDDRRRVDHASRLRYHGSCSFFLAWAIIKSRRAVQSYGLPVSQSGVNASRSFVPSASSMALSPPNNLREEEEG
jgi:hypothetical protein